MSPKIDLTGKEFGKLIVLSDTGKRRSGKGKNIYWLCRCSCGNFYEVSSTHLRTGHTKSCGCLHGEQHGMKNTHIYSVWQNMKQRCYNSNKWDYKYYGGRGIKVCPRWKNSFINFYEDMGDPPNIDMELDRKDNNRHYSERNCRWVTHKQNSRNSRRARNITFNGKTQCVTAWAEELNMPRYILSDRLNKHGWPIEKALTQPVRK